jgi:hypothetical protein
MLCMQGVTDIRDLPSDPAGLDKKPILKMILQAIRDAGVKPTTAKFDKDDLFPPCERDDGEFRDNPAPRVTPMASPLAPARISPSELGRRIQMTSRNWSGAVTLAHHGERLDIVAAIWRAPDVSHVTNTGKPQLFSMWIGFDGHRRHAESMPQIGTLHGHDGKNLVQHAWHQWWVRGRSIAPRKITSLPVAAGNRMCGWMERDTGGMAVRIYFANLDQHVLVAYHLPAPPALNGGPGTPVAGKAADWIIERTTEMCSSSMYPLAAPRETVAFDHWAAASRDPASTDDRITSPVRLYTYDDVPAHERAIVRLKRSESTPLAGDRLRRRGLAPIAVRYKP